MFQDLRDEYDVRYRYEEGAPARGRLRQHARRGRAQLGAQPQGPPLARRPAPAVRQVLQGERGHHHWPLFRRHLRDVVLLQGQRLSRGGVLRAQ